MLSGLSYEDTCSCCMDRFEDGLYTMDVTDIDDVISSANGLRNTYSGDVIDDADLPSPRDSLSCDLYRSV